MAQHPVHVLILAAEPDCGCHLQTLLQKLDLKVVECVSTASDAVAAMQRHLPDLVMLDDLALPDHQPMLELIGSLQSIRRVPMLMVTDGEATELVELAAQQGVGACLTRPVDRRQLAPSLAIARARFAHFRQVQELNAQLEASNAQLAAQIRERTSAEQALRLSEQKYRTLVENAPDVFLRLDREGVCVFASPNVAWRIGLARNEIIGSKLEAIFEWRSTSRDSVAVINEVLDSGQPQEMEVTDCGPLRERIFSLRFVPDAPRLDELTEMVLCVCRDISDLKAAEQALLRAQQLSAVGTLAGGIAHQFNNLHAIILGNADLMLASPELPESFASRLLRIRKTIERAGETIQKLAALTSQARLKEELIPANHLVSESMLSMEETLVHEGIALRLQLEATAAVTVDRHQFHHVLHNLVSNARHAMLGVEQRELIIGTREVGQMVAIQVCDTGRGILPENLDKVFLPFFSTKGEHSRGESPDASVRGTGLGLSVSEIIVRNHGGTLTLNSTPGKGTTFTISLPAVVEATNQLLTPELPDQSNTGRRVLIVDDEPLIRLLLLDVLKAAGYEVKAASTALEALDTLDEAPVDLLLVDLMLPGMDGIQFIRNVRHRSADGRQPSIVVITGRITSSERAALEELRVLEILIKPFKMQSVLQLVRRHLDAADATGQLAGQ